MKKTPVCLILLLAVLTQTCGMADGGRMSLSEMLVSLSEHPELSEADAQLLSDISDLFSCGGMYYHSDEAPKKVHYADLEFYYLSGVPFCHIEYNNYMGKLSDAPIHRAEEDDWLFQVDAPGEFFGREQTLTFLIAANRIHVSWGDDIQYDLTRDAVEAEAISFVQSDSYEKICTRLDELIGDKNDHLYNYDEANREMTVYIAFDADPRNNSYNEQLKSSWKTLTDSLLSLSSTMRDALDLATREGITDYQKAHFTIYLVTTIGNAPKYHPENVLTVISDGILYYDIFFGS